MATRSNWLINNMAAFAAVQAAATACAADFPVKPVRIMTPFPPGGSVDLVARLLGAELGKAWGQQVIVDNRSGASGNIGTEIAKNAAPDGYTLLLNTLPFVTNQFVYSKMPYDPITDFAPISLVSSMAALLVVHPSLPVRSVRELIALAKSKPGAISYATAGPATNPHIASELLNYLGKTNLFAVHYKGGGAATTATISGENHVFFSNTISDVLPQVEAKRLRALGVTSLQRSPVAPQIPTLAESGLPGYEFTTWHVFAAPAGTPRAVINQINDKVRANLRTPETVQRWRERSVEIVANTPDETADYLKKEVQKWRVVFKERGMRAE
ncbi:MAG: tripartite tricarboxylate transporter substrate binding protein [Betaproteobacteria bacterium]|nr:tripartite tricarboxylate transporter substrate binding protein [Betaproteobacteria bacterium]